MRYLPAVCAAALLSLSSAVSGEAFAADCGAGRSCGTEEQAMLQLGKARAAPSAQCDRERYLDRVLVCPQRRLAFCYVEKVASAQFNKLFNQLNHFQVSQWQESSWKNFGIDPKNVTRRNGWFRGVFLRDPAERLLSAFLSKCTARPDGTVEDGGAFCAGEVLPTNVSEGSAASVAAFEALVLRLLGKSRPQAGNPHFDPQRCFCGGLSEDLQEFDYVGLLQESRRDTNEQVRAMLERAGVDRGIAGNLANSSFPVEDLNQWHHDTHADRVYEAYFKKQDTRKAVEELFAEDYQLPRLKAVRDERLLRLGILSTERLVDRRDAGQHR